MKNNSLRRCNTSQIGLITILIVAAGLRLSNLGSESLWNDELASWNFSNAQTIAEVLDRTAQDVHPPGYQLLLFGVMQVFGDSEWALRLPSAVAGTLAVLLTYLVGVRIASEKVGLLAASLIAVSYAPIYYSQEARAYSVLMFGALWTNLLWLRLFMESGTKREAIGYFIVATLTAYLHYFGLLMIATQLCTAGLICITRRQWPVLPALLGLGLVAAYSPWLKFMYSASQRTIWIEHPGFGEAILGYLKFGLPNNSLAIALFSGLLFLFCALTLRKVRSVAGVEIALLGWLIVPPTIAYLVSWLVTPVWTGRNLIIILPATYLAISIPVFRPPIKRFTPIFVILLPSLAAADLALNRQYYSGPNKQQFREVADYVCKHAETKNVMHFSWDTNYFEYYGAECNLSNRIGAPVGQVEDIDRLSDTLDGFDGAEFWFFWAHRQPDPEFWKALNERAVVLEDVEFNGAKAVRLRPKTFHSHR